MTPEREKLEEQLNAFMAAKRAAKGVDDAAFVKNSAAVVATLMEIKGLPEDNKLTDFQVGAYCWALHALASKSKDPASRREYTARLVKSFRKAIDSPQFWGDGRAKEFGKTLFNMMVVCLHKIVKESNAEARDAVLRKVAGPFEEILSMRAESFLDEAAFKKDPVTGEQRAMMERNNGGKPIRMKEWPSITEKAFGVLNHGLRADPALMVSAELIDFLFHNREKGTWLGFYCANAMVRAGRHAEARSLLMKVVRKNPEADWAWTHLADTCRDAPGDAMACLCRSLTCSNRDPEIAKATEAKTHRQLARMLAALGDNVTAARESRYANGEAVSPEDFERYAAGVKAANRLVFGNEMPPKKKQRGNAPQGGGGGDRCVKFAGVLLKAEGKNFGFVRCRDAGKVFVPPKFASKMKNGDWIEGMAEMREDRRKRRMGLCMVLAL